LTPPAGGVFARVERTGIEPIARAAKTSKAIKRRQTDANRHSANVWQDEKKAGLEPAKNHTLRG
jgi:hypothetical protein